MSFFNKPLRISDYNAPSQTYGYWEEDISKMLANNFPNWALTNYGAGYAHLTKKGHTANIANTNTKARDCQLHARCHSLLGKRKSTRTVESIGRQAFNNGGGCCTTSAYACAFKLLEMGVGTTRFPGSRIEIIGQPGMSSGHMWVLVNRLGGTLKGNNTTRLANPPSTWGGYLAVDTWLMGFGWEGVWQTPIRGEHHSFITMDLDKIQVVYDSNSPEGD